MEKKNRIFPKTLDQDRKEQDEQDMIEQYSIELSRARWDRNKCQNKLG